MGPMLTAVAIVVMTGSIFLIPLGLPGLWIMLAVLAVGAWLGEVGVGLLIGLILVGLAAEGIEFLAVKRLSARYGGSPRAFWGAIAGGLIGVFMGMPVPIIGSVIAGVLGSFAGAAAIAFWETRHAGAAARVGWGAVLGRVIAAAVKVGAGVAILAVGIASLLRG